MLKQQDMTETARVVFNELSVTEPATVGEIAQNTYLSRERCRSIYGCLDAQARAVLSGQTSL
ncbi:TPA: TrmB family transcriptional regulator [Escherichia coli]|nr:TrmB family transcriptional regulator [Escherichia coli]HEI3181436.1 TrmB family transcriptional regulator [Escherichia coli]HEI3297626.1 TrmB family transcriptional regulator [Escherichia coli]